MFWSTDEDKGVDLVKKAMSRNRFREIKRNLHVSDNSSLDKRDKFSKLRPFIEYLNKKFIQFGIFSHNLSIDEQMVPYFGRHSAKMFIKGKPVRFGFKIWCLCSSNGYLYQFQPYGGATQILNDVHKTLGERVVVDLLHVVQDPSHHRVFFDNFFLPLLYLSHFERRVSLQLVQFAMRELENVHSRAKRKCKKPKEEVTIVHKTIKMRLQW